MKKIEKGTARRILLTLRPHLPLLLLSTLLAVGVVVLTLYIPVAVGNAIDLALGAGRVDFSAIGRILVNIAVAAVATAALQWLMSLLHNRVTYHVIRDLRFAAFDRLTRVPLSYLDSQPHGGIVSRMISDVDQFADGLLMGFSQLFTGVLTIAGTLIFMFRIRPEIAAVVVLVTPLSLFVARFIAKKTHNMFAEQASARGEQTAFIGEMVAGQKTVAAFSREDENLKIFDTLNKRLSKTSLRAVFFSSLTNPSTRFVNNLVYAGVALTGALFVLSAPLAFTVGSLTAFLSYANQYTKPFNEISGVLTELQNAVVCASRVFALIDEREETPDPVDAACLSDVRGAVAMENVSFSYVPERPLIEELSLSVTAGQRVAIVGPTGCGKTTLINLLMRFYDVREGKITVDGTDITALTRHGLRENYGMVLQDTVLYADSVRNNIKFGRPDATDEEMIAAAKAAHAHSFIKRLPNGYDTLLSEGGGNLSQGQRQLLSIARVMLALPPMLILDEATSSIDTRTEQKIQNAFAVMMKGRTSFIVAHRLSTIKEADVILVMKDGNVIEKGTHEELLALHGFYHTLYNSQFEE